MPAFCLLTSLSLEGEQGEDGARANFLELESGDIGKGQRTHDKWMDVCTSTYLLFWLLSSQTIAITSF